MVSKLSKAEIVKNINESTGIPAADILRIINAFFDEIKDGMKDGKIGSDNSKILYLTLLLHILISM